MGRLIRLIALLGLFGLVQTVELRADSLHCYMTGGICPGFGITCDWDDPDDCSSQEAAYDLCVELCFTECSPGRNVDYGNTFGNPCGQFTCWCMPIE